MMKLSWKRFLLWMHVNHRSEVHHLEEGLQSISIFHDGVLHISFTALMDYACCSRMLLLFQQHLGAIGNGNSLTAFWMYCLYVDDVTLCLFRAAI